ncbi:MAG: hypothetical protein MMC23_005430 [Stictis urceolatum]|nr:hypothetical protein [Stictis urceolata]
MATLEHLKRALKHRAETMGSSLQRPLSETQYNDGFDILVTGSNWKIYQDFVIPQFSQLLDQHFSSRTNISALEIGPGPKSLFGYIPDHLKVKIGSYTAFEPNGSYAARLKDWFCCTSEKRPALPCLQNSPKIHQAAFDLGDTKRSNTNGERYDIILFCHSMYGMKPQRRIVERAIEMLTGRPQSGIVVVFHRDGKLRLDGLVCHQTKSFIGNICVKDDDVDLSRFASFIAGFVIQDLDINGDDINKTELMEWRKVCRLLGRRLESQPEHLSFSSPDIMAAFTNHASKLPELEMKVSLVKNRQLKHPGARLHHPAAIFRPTEPEQVRKCVRWALKYGVSLAVIGGGHSGHCVHPNVVSVDMSAFDQVHIITEQGGRNSNSLVVVGAGCKTGDVINKTMAEGVTVPLGARPSVGAGLWLQGGIGHLARLYGLSCDSIVGAVVISVDSGQIVCVGYVPSQQQPRGANRRDDEADLLWAIKGAGTNLGIVLSVTFKTHPAPTYLVRSWAIPLRDEVEARHRITEFDTLVASKLPQNCSVDAYLYWQSHKLHLGVTMLDCSVTTTPVSTSTPVYEIFGPENDVKAVDGVGLFDSEMYMHELHGGHGGGKTSSFKRCLFLRNIGEADIAGRLVAAISNRPSKLCYLHLLQGGGAVRDIAADATAFGCRDWDFGCVITGVWAREQDDTEVALSAVRWVYSVVEDILPLSTCSGTYGADLGPDPRDIPLAAKAFGPNGQRLARLKHRLDPRNVLAYACPLPKVLTAQKIIILVTGESCAGKDYCAEIWADVLVRSDPEKLAARVISISDAVKREYAAATGADLKRLLLDRVYKEQHRPALTAFFREQVRQRPHLPEEHFLNLVKGAADVDALLITGMRDKAPLAALSSLVPKSRLVQVQVQADKQIRRIRGLNGVSDESDDEDSDHSKCPYRPSLTFDNVTAGNEAATTFAKRRLIPFFQQDLQRLADMVPLIRGFPCPSIDFHHVLGICQQAKGLALCRSLLQDHFIGDWAKVGAVISCEAGGIVFAAPLAERVELPLVLVRRAGKLPPPVVATSRSPSFISSLESEHSENLEMERDAVPEGVPVVVVDDVLSTGQTLCAVLQLLHKNGVDAEHISVMVVAELPSHRGRNLLFQSGFGKCVIQSLLIYDGA